MAEQAEDISAEHADDHDTPGYVAPKESTLEEMMKKDDADESLKKYKEALLGADNVVGLELYPNDPRRVLVQKLALVVNGRPDVELDLSGADLTQLKKSPFIIKEGTQYRIKILFYVQREIVTGLKYVQRSFRKGIQVDKSNYMVGSYGPKKELQFFQTPWEEAPSGMIARGHYNVKSLFTDDDKNEHLKWEWALEIKKDWQ